MDVHIINGRVLAKSDCGKLTVKTVRVEGKRVVAKECIDGMHIENAHAAAVRGALEVQEQVASERRARAPGRRPN